MNYKLDCRKSQLYSYHNVFYENVFFNMPFGFFLQTPLHIATYLQQSFMVRTLVDYGGSLAFVDNSGDTPLHIACATGSTKIVDFISVTSMGYKPDGISEALQTRNYDGMFYLL